MEAPDSDKREDDRWDGAVNQFVGGWGRLTVVASTGPQ